MDVDECKREGFLTAHSTQKKDKKNKKDKKDKKERKERKERKAKKEKKEKKEKKAKKEKKEKKEENGKSEEEKNEKLDLGEAAVTVVACVPARQENRRKETENGAEVLRRSVHKMADGEVLPPRPQSEDEEEHVRPPRKGERFK